MNKYTARFLALILSVVSLSFTFDANARGQWRVRDDVVDAILQQVPNTQLPIVVEFYRAGDPDDPAEPDDCDRCANQKPVYDAEAAKYAGKVIFIRYDVLTNPALMTEGNITVFPTHVFLSRDGKSGIARNGVRGYLEGKQFEELISEFFAIKP